ncbi:MAG TPA: COX15/CtaA family protein, partial [Telmatospirillum sp.]|nr:COX15/CtaA family protein [Telmatospirillum sp.]
MQAKRGRWAVGIWLLTLALMVLVMVCLGGLTRLTGSGLSMVEWQPFTLLPPLSDDAWNAVFTKYQGSPQYRLINDGMTLAAFKSIFWLEYVHRLWGRLIGLAFLGPFVVFLGGGWLSREDVPWLLFLFLLGALQGGLGWFMVASGLADQPEVSHYRLAAHLLAAVAIYAALLWSALDHLDFYPRAICDHKGSSSLSSSPGLTRQSMDPRVKPGDDDKKRRFDEIVNCSSNGTVSGKAARLARPLILLLGLVVLTMAAGALVAGLHAGLIYNSFPLMNGAWFPREAFDLSPVWINVFENHALVQFDHRLLAMASWVGAVALWLWSRP